MNETCFDTSTHLVQSYDHQSDWQSDWTTCQLSLLSKTETTTEPLTRVWQRKIDCHALQVWNVSRRYAIDISSVFMFQVTNSTWIWDYKTAVLTDVRHHLTTKPNSCHTVQLYIASRLVLRWTSDMPAALVTGNFHTWYTRIWKVVVDKEISLVKQDMTTVLTNVLHDITFINQKLISNYNLYRHQHKQAKTT